MWNNKYFLTKIYKNSLDLFLDYIPIKIELLEPDILICASPDKFYYYSLYKPGINSNILKFTNVVYKINNTYIDKYSYNHKLLNINNGLISNGERFDWADYDNQLIFYSYDIITIPIEIVYSYNVNTKEITNFLQ